MLEILDPLLLEKYQIGSFKFLGERSQDGPNSGLIKSCKANSTFVLTHDFNLFYLDMGFCYKFA